MGCKCGARTYAEHVKYLAKGVTAHPYVSSFGRIG